MTAGGGQGWTGQGPGYGEQPGAPDWQGYGQAVPGQAGYPGQQPVYPAPGQPVYPAPGQPTYPTSGQPVYPAPGQQPVYPAPGQPAPYGPPPTAAQPGYPPSATGSQPVFGASGYGQQPPAGWQPPAGPPTGFGTPPPPAAPKKSRLPVIITVIAVVIALLAAGLIWFIARKNSDEAAGGQSTPVEAATQLLGSVTTKDAIGIAEGLDPTEAHLFSDMSGDVLTQLKRLGIISDSVSPSATGTTVTTSGLTFGQSPIVINDHISVVELTGGTVTLHASGGSVFSDKLQQAFPALKDASSAQDTTVNISDEVAKLGHPIRIATVNRDGKWYVSLFYTAADNAAFEQNPSYQLGTPIASTGGSSPEAAMDILLDKALAGDVAGVIGVLSPDEMGVLHDYGNLIVNQAGSTGSDLGGVKLSDVAWNVTDVTGGKKVSVKSLTITSGDQKTTVQVDPSSGSIALQVPGQGTVNVTKDNINTWISENGGPDALPGPVADIIQREFPQMIGLGVVMVQSADGKWYVSPLRTFSDVLTSLLKGLEPTDIDYFISLAQGK